MSPAAPERAIEPPSRRPATVSALVASSLFAGLIMVALTVWTMVVTEFGLLVVIFVGAPGLVLLGGTLGLLSGQPWARRILVGGLILGANSAFWLGLFVFLTREAARPTIANMLLISSVAAFALFAFLLVLVRTTSVSRHLWAVELGKMGRTPDEELLDDVAFDFEKGDDLGEEDVPERERARHEVGL